jgi:DNA adenine methylase
LSDSEKIETKIHPFLRWAGGKKWLVRRIITSFDVSKFSSYHEPFVGGGAMLFYFQPKNAFISDSNEQLIQTYITVRNNIDDVIEVIRGFGRTEDDYYSVRGLQTEDAVIRAAKFIYLNQLSYNGIYRVNASGGYNVPWGKRMSYQFDFENLIKVSNYLQGVQINSMDFEDCIDNVGQNSLVFLDPPYTHSKVLNGFIQYNQKVFTEEDQGRLSSLIDRIKERDAYYILTNADHPRIKEIFDKHDNIIPITRNSGIGGKNAQRGNYEECIFTNTNLTL